MIEFESRIAGVVDTILSDYQGSRDIDQMDIFRHPDKDVVVELIGKLRRIIFPGYFRDNTYRIYNAKHNLSMLIEDVMFNLSNQIALVLQGSGMEDIVHAVHGVFHAGQVTDIADKEFDLTCGFGLFCLKFVTHIVLLFFIT